MKFIGNKIFISRQLVEDSPFEAPIKVALKLYFARTFTNTCFNLYVLKTDIMTDFDLPYSDVLIFTSPSNVTAYYNKYKPDTRQLVIAIGPKTKLKLSEYGVDLF